MWVRKQEADAQWQEFSTPAAALHHIKAEGAPSTLQQVQIERAAKNSKPRNGFEFSYNPPAAAVPQQRPQSQAASLHSEIACLFVVTPVVFLLQALHWSTWSLPKDWRRGWKRSPRPWCYGCEASNNDASQQSAASSAAFYFSVVQLVLTCL